jgi:hypothetical protein
LLSLSAGVQFGIFFTIFFAALHKDLCRHLTTCINDKEPSASTLKSTETLPCIFFLLALAGYLKLASIKVFIAVSPLEYCGIMSTPFLVVVVSACANAPFDQVKDRETSVITIIFLILDSMFANVSSSNNY